VPGENPSQPYVASDDVNPSYEAEYREVMANLNSLVGGYHGLLWEAADSQRDCERALALFVVENLPDEFPPNLRIRCQLALNQCQIARLIQDHHVSWADFTRVFTARNGPVRDTGNERRMLRDELLQR
jgi:hypothetical protein